MIFRLTEDLARKVRMAPPALHPLHVNAFSDWSAHILRAGRNTLLLAINTRSLYSVLAPGEGIVSPRALEARLYAHIKHQLMEDGFEFICRRLLDRDGETTHFSKTLSAQSDATLRDFAELVAYHVAEDGKTPEATLHKLNHTSLSILDQRTPRQTFETMGF